MALIYGEMPWPWSGGAVTAEIGAIFSLVTDQLLIERSLMGLCWLSRFVRRKRVLLFSTAVPPTAPPCFPPPRSVRTRVLVLGSAQEGAQHKGLTACFLSPCLSCLSCVSWAAGHDKTSMA